MGGYAILAGLVLAGCAAGEGTSRSKSLEVLGARLDRSTLEVETPAYLAVRPGRVAVTMLAVKNNAVKARTDVAMRPAPAPPGAPGSTRYLYVVAPGEEAAIEGFRREIMQLALGVHGKVGFGLDPAFDLCRRGALPAAGPVPVTISARVDGSLQRPPQTLDLRRAAAEGGVAVEELLAPCPPGA